VLQALRASHPYEEPAFDLVRLAVAPVSIRGLGRIGSLAAGRVPREQLIATIKAGLGVERLLVAGPREGDVERVAVCAGACGDLYKDAIARKAEVYVTGELRHHDALAAAARGLTVVAALHSNSERRALDHLADRLRAHVEVVRSERDRDPFTVT
jgi:putative NIF3 family GTP cyclohydrolase 1 type 2